MALFDGSLVPAANANGTALAGAKWWFYQSGGLTPANVYSDADLNTSLGATVTADSAGRFVPIYLDPAVEYRAILKTAAGVQVGPYDIDPVNVTSGAMQAEIDALEVRVTALEAFENSFGAADSITVGAGGDYTTLVAALDWLKTQPLNRPMTVNLLEKNTPDTSGGSMAIPDTGYTFDHPNSRNVYFVGPAWTGGQRLPTNADMTGTKATDLATVKGLSSASIRFNGADDTTGTIGLSFPYGVGGFTRILFECRNRYNISVGFNSSHATATGNSTARFVNCAWFGGVWGVIGQDAFLSLAEGGCWFGYQISGAPVGLFGGAIETDAALFEAYYPTGDGANNPKYVVYADGCRLYMNGNNFANKIKAKGSFLHGLYAINGAAGWFMSPNFDGITQPLTIGAADIRAGTPIITNADPTKTASVPLSTQPGPPGNEASGALFSVGPGGSLAMNGATITASECNYALLTQGGNYHGFGTISLTDCKTNIDTIRVTGSKGNLAAVSVASARVGSVNQVRALQNGDIFLYSASGVSYSPALNTPTNGAGIYN